jgi:hypothetical protein
MRRTPSIFSGCRPRTDWSLCLEPLRGDREGQWSTRINDQANRTARDRCGSFLTASYTGFQRIGTDWGQV